MNSTNTPTPSRPDFFHDELPEDKLVAIYQEYRKINDEGIVNPIHAEFDSSIFNLDKAAREYIENIFCKAISLNGRRNELYPGVTISIKEISENADSYAKTLNGKAFKLHLKGGTILSAIESMVGLIFEAWCYNLPEPLRNSNALLSPTFLAIMRLVPNDTDWVFDLEGGIDSKNQKQLIQNALINPLAKQFKAQNSNPYSLVIKLLKLEKAGRKIAYLNNIFKNYSALSASMDKLHHLCIEVFGFKTAIDAPNFSLRTLEKHDCVFPLKSTILTTAKDTLFINIPPVLSTSIEAAPLRLESLMGDTIESVIQALSDRNLLLITFDPSKPADLSDFGRTISYLTTGGRCFQKGWLKSVVDAIKLGCIHQKITLAELVKSQLINRITNHHSNEPAILIALTFNASALLYWMDPSNENEIKNLWKLIFTYIDQPENLKSQCLTSDLTENIKTHLQDLNFNFLSLYHFTFQLGAHIDQHRSKNSDSYPTQTEGELFTQWRISFDTKQNQRHPICALFFPFQLSTALKYINSLTLVPKPILSHFNSIINDFSLDFTFGGSRLYKYAEDPRRNYSGCLEEALLLLQKKEEDLWALGLLTVLPLLALKNDSAIFRLVFENFFSRIRKPWNSIELRQNCIQLYCRTLKKSGIEIDPEIFNALIQKDKNKIKPALGLISALVKSGNPSFIACAQKFLTVLETHFDKFDYRSLTDLYGEIIRFSAELILDDILNKNFTEIYSQWFLEVIQRSARQTVFTPQTKLIWFLQIYDELNLKVLSENVHLEEELFEAISMSLELINFLPKDLSESKIASICLKLLVSRNRSHNSFKAICLVRNLFKLISPENPERNAIKEAVKLIFPLNLTIDDDIFQVNEIDFNMSEIKKTWPDFANSDAGLLSSNEIDKFIFLLNHIIKKKSDFEQLCSILNSACKPSFIKNLSYFQQNEICRILINFQKEYGEKHPRECYNILLDFIKEFKDKKLVGKLADSIYQLLIGMETCKQFGPEVYSQFIEHLHQNALQNCTLVKQYPGNFFHMLNSYGMQKEILGFFALLGHSHVSQSFEIFRMIILALQSSKKEEGGYGLSTEVIEELLLRAPLIPQGEPEILKHVIRINHFLFLHHSKSGSLIEAHNWFKRELCSYRNLQGSSLDENFIDKAFSLTHQLIVSENIPEAQSIAKLINFSENMQLDWLKTFSSMLENNQIRSCVNLMETISLKKCKTLPISDSWIEILDGMLTQSNQIAQMQDKNSCKLLSTLHEIAYKIFCSNQFKSKEIWKHFFNTLTLHGPINIVENTFTHFLCSDQEIPLNKIEKNESKKLFMARLCLEGSVLLLDAEKCWVPFLEELDLKSLLEVKEEEDCSPELLELYDLWEGAIKACKINVTISNFDSKLLKIINLFNEDILDPLLNYYAAKLLSYSKSESLMSIGIRNVVDIFINGNSSPFLQKKTVNLTNEYAVRMEKFQIVNHSDQLNDAIYYSIKNSYSENACHIKLLSLLNKIKNVVIREISVNAISRGLFSTSSTNTTTIYYFLRLNVIEKILTNNWVKNHRYSLQDREIINVGLTKAIFMNKRNLDTQGLILFLDNRDIIKFIIGPKSFNDLNGIITSTYATPKIPVKFFLKWLNSCNECRRSAFRFKKMYDRNAWSKSYIMPHEYKSIVINGSLNITVIFVVAMTIYSIFHTIFSGIFSSKQNQI